MVTGVWVYLQHQLLPGRELQSNVHCARHGTQDTHQFAHVTLHVKRARNMRVMANERNLRWSQRSLPTRGTSSRLAVEGDDGGLRSLSHLNLRSISCTKPLWETIMLPILGSLQIDKLKNDKVSCCFTTSKAFSISRSNQSLYLVIGVSSNMSSTCRRKTMRPSGVSLV